MNASAPITADWRRTAVIYQIYPRSFADASGDGMGDLAGIISHLDDLSYLGIDAIWLSPIFTSPQKDAGYDVSDFRGIDPMFGDLETFDRLIAEAHSRNIRVIADIVPNHSSDQHEWFQEALTAAPGSTARNRYMFREGTGENGELPPNNWQSVFSGPAWTRVTEADGNPGQWYLHLFDSSQPDLNWENPEVLNEFDDVLRFWLDRGVDGFRVDVAHGLIKKAGLPDFVPHAEAASMGGEDAQASPYWAQPEVHEVWRRWRRIIDSYPGERVLCAEAWIYPLSKMAQWVRPDEMHQAFNFAYLETPWDADRLENVIRESLHEFGQVGAPSSWVLSNHDVVRHASRLALTADNPQGDGIGPKSVGLPDRTLGLTRARAATLLTLALPGGAYVYAGEELGLPEVIDLPDESRQDPTWFRSNGERYGRDGCRVPIPWTSAGESYGFNSTGESWLPQPAYWADYARDQQVGREGSTLEMYRAAIRERRARQLAIGDITDLASTNGVLTLRNGDITVVANTTSDPVPLPAGTVALSSQSVSDVLPGNTTVWLLP